MDENKNKNNEDYTPEEITEEVSEPVVKKKAPLSKGALIGIIGGALAVLVAVIVGVVILLGGDEPDTPDHDICRDIPRSERWDFATRFRAAPIGC